MQEHYRLLEAIYAKAPIHEFYSGIAIKFNEGSAEIRLKLKPIFNHAGGSVHGSVYFKLLDDAAYFAAQSLVTDKFLLTSSFHLQLFRPLINGQVTAIGEVNQITKNICTASSKLFDESGKLCAQGSGQFMRSNVDLKNL